MSYKKGNNEMWIYFIVSHGLFIGNHMTKFKIYIGDNMYFHTSVLLNSVTKSWYVFYNGPKKNI